MPFGHIMEEDDAARAHARQPALEVVSYGIVGVQAIDVEQVYGAIKKSGQGFLEQRLLQAGEVAIERIMVSAQVGEYGRAVGARMRIARPRVDGHATGIEAKVFDGLTERAVGDALARAQLHDAVWPQELDQVHGEGHVEAPGRERPSARLQSADGQITRS